MASVRQWVLEYWLVARLGVALVVGLLLPGAYLLGLLPQYHPLSPRAAIGPAVSSDDDTWVLNRRSEHFSFYTRPGQGIPDWAVEFNEYTYTEVSRLLPRPQAPQIKYYKYRSQADLQRALGQFRKGYADQSEEGGIVHSVYSYHPHEVVHALTYSIGRPPALFEEGVAVAYDRWSALKEGDVHALARSRLMQQRLLPLGSILTTRDFQAHDSAIAYIEAGSFVRYLLDTYGPDKMWSLFTLPRESERQEIDAAFQKIYGRPVAEVEGEWRAFLLAWHQEESPLDGKLPYLFWGSLSLILLLVGGMALTSLVDKAFEKLGAVIGKLAR